MRMGVVADDITGANDIGGLFTAAGYLVHVYHAARFDATQFQAGAARPDVLVLDTNSRLDPPELAYAKVQRATRALLDIGAPRLFNKTCSVFRGNIGAEFDAVLDLLGARFAVVILGFPRNGRLTRDGIHYVHGVRLEDSSFRDDPIHPMRRSDLVEILQAQTGRTVSLIDHRLIAQGAEALRAAIDERREQGGYAILDVSGQEALRTIARATADEPLLCGSSALAEELPVVWGPSAAVGMQELPPPDDVGVLCVAGSLTPQTLAQIAHLRRAGVASFELQTAQLFAPEVTPLDPLVDGLVAELGRGQNALVYAVNSPEAVAATRQAGARAGESPHAVARRVTDSLAEIAARSLERSGGRRLLVAGGETSAAVCTRLGVAGMQVLDEIAPGVPACVSLGAAPLLLVLKSGSFGSEAFLEQALRYLADH